MIPDTHREPWYGKVMLFGEYSLLLGSKALVIPLKIYSGNWTNEKPVLESEKQLSYELHGYVSYLQQQQQLNQLLDIKSLNHDISAGWWFRSSIPLGYGAGSSGAVTAAIYETYAYETATQLAEIKSQLGLMESYFHGNSSGIDPLCCLLRRPVLIESEGKISLPENVIPPSKFQVFLYDSLSTGKTGPLVAFFKAQMHTWSFYKKTSRQWLPAVDQAIESFLGAGNKSFAEALLQLSAFELSALKPMIPNALLPLWEQGLKNGVYTMKLCGSGGGGFSLIFTEEASRLPEFFNPARLIRLF